MMQQLNTLLQMPAARLQQNMQHIVDCLPRLLGEGVPRKVLDTIQRLWFQLHSLSPRRYAVPIWCCIYFSGCVSIFVLVFVHACMHVYIYASFLEV